MSLNTLQRAMSANENMTINAGDYKRSTAGIVLEVIFGVLTGGLAAIGVEVYHAFNKSNKSQEFAELTGDLLKGMKNMPPDANGFDFGYQGSTVQVEQDGNNVKIKYCGEEKFIYDKTINELKENLKKEIVHNVDKCSVESAVMALQDETANQRSLAISVLQGKTNLHQFDHVKTVDLVQAAVDLISDTKNIAQIHNALDKTEFTGKMVLDAESKELLKKWQVANKDNIVDVGVVDNSKLAEKNRPVQSEDEKKVRKLFAEVFFPEKSWEADILEPGERLKNVCIENASALAEIYAKPELIDAAGIPEGLSTVAKETLASLKKQVDLFGGEINQNTIKVILERIPAESFTKLSASIDENFEDFKFSSLDGVQMLSNIGNVGEGNLQSFVKNVLGKYFDNQAVVDKRAMISSFLNDARAGDTDERKLVGLLKGGGPYLQKMLQLLGDSAPPALKEALDEMKASLSPINDQIIKSILNGIIEKSGGKIVKIELGKNLGAASVGQTVLANIKWNGKDESQEVVVKLLRPGIRLRADRELVFMRQEADKIAGMRKTFDGISEQVQVEMDLSKEAHNVRQAQVYSTGHTNLTAMKLVDKVPPSQGYMVLEKARGTTVKSAFNELEEMTKAPMDAKNKAPDTGAKLASGIKALTSKWVEEGLFGTGFYHGDLHSGNIMFADDNGLLTVIDMGNATTLSVEQRKAVFKMVMAAGVHSPEVFVRNFEKVLSDEGKIRISDKRAELLEQTKQIMSDAKDPGKIIFSILDAANKLGLEIPATVSNFSRSQIMLQNAIHNINGINDHISKKLLDEINMYAPMFISNMEDVTLAGLPDLIKQEIVKLENNGENEAVVNYKKSQLEMLLQHSTKLLSKDLDPVDFSRIIESVGLNHKMDSLGLAYGDILALRSARNDWMARPEQLGTQVNKLA